VTASELAFLALGLLLGAATGAAGIFVFSHRPPRREIRVTVTRDAVPRRSETLSQDAFVTSPAEPARGGPGDRRWFDRRDDVPEFEPTRRDPMPATADRRAPAPRVPARPPTPVLDRTPVPSASPVGIAIHPESGLEPDLEMGLELEDARRRPAGSTTIERILRGEALALVEAVDRIAGPDSGRRRDWELAFGQLAASLGDIAVEESVIDFPMGTAFWDTFTVEQCRRIVAALASMGFRYDGRSGWLDQRVPAYRDLSQALADIEVDPRRVRAWPNQSEIAGLFVGARPAPEELLPAAGPDYSAESMRGLLGPRAAELEPLWLAWEAVGPLLFASPVPAAEAGARPLAPEGSPLPKGSLARD
jgi:hypothetical protein